MHQIHTHYCFYRFWNELNFCFSLSFFLSLTLSLTHSLSHTFSLFFSFSLYLSLSASATSFLHLCCLLFSHFPSPLILLLTWHFIFSSPSSLSWFFLFYLSFITFSFYHNLFFSQLSLLNIGFLNVSSWFESDAANSWLFSFKTIFTNRVEREVINSTSHGLIKVTISQWYKMIINLKQLINLWLKEAESKTKKERWLLWKAEEEMLLVIAR